MAGAPGAGGSPAGGGTHTGGAPPDGGGRSGGGQTGGGSAGASTLADAGVGGAPAITCNADGTLDRGEQCDDGNSVEDDGCNGDCRWSCDPNAPLACEDGVFCNGQEICGADHRCYPGSAPPSGTLCGETSTCIDGLCEPVNCGDGVLQSPDEECDDSNEINGDGCGRDCRFTCLPGDPSRDCSRVDPCSGASTCLVSVHLCTQPTPLADGTPCALGVCMAGVCIASCVDAGFGCN